MRELEVALATETRRARGRRRRRRPAAARLHLLPPGALHRGADRADAAAARRPHHARDRARLPRLGGDRRAAHRARQAHARGSPRSVRGARAATSSRRGCRRCSRSSTWSSTRATRRPPATTGCARTLCDEALRLGRVLAELAPREPEVHGLVALMEIQASRLRARTGPRGEPVLLLDQDRARWDQLLIRRGLAALERAERARRRLRPVRAAGRDRRLPRAGAHRRARPTGRGSPRSTTRSPSSRRRRWSSSTARSRWRWRSARRPGSSSSTRCATSRRSQGYHLLPSVRGDLLAKLGRTDEARAELKRAAELTRNERERALLLERAAALVA